MFAILKLDPLYAWEHPSYLVFELSMSGAFFSLITIIVMDLNINPRELSRRVGDSSPLASYPRRSGTMTTMMVVEQFRSEKRDCGPALLCPSPILSVPDRHTVQCPLRVAPPGIYHSKKQSGMESKHSTNT